MVSDSPQAQLALFSPTDNTQTASHRPPHWAMAVQVCLQVHEPFQVAVTASVSCPCPCPCLPRTHASPGHADPRQERELTDGISVEQCSLRPSLPPQTGREPSGQKQSSQELAADRLGRQSLQGARGRDRRPSISNWVGKRFWF